MFFYSPYYLLYTCSCNIIMDRQIAASFGHFLPFWNGYLYGWISSRLSENISMLSWFNSTHGIELAVTRHQ
jgi:hypothetical protein